MRALGNSLLREGRFDLVFFSTTSAVAITDGLDGLLAGTAAFAFGAYAVIAFLQGQAFLAVFSFTVTGALLGFLWYNAHPAAVFMGDTGALPLGAALATGEALGCDAALPLSRCGAWLAQPLTSIANTREPLT